MPELRAAAPQDTPALRRLWQQAFGDGDTLLDFFFASGYRPEDMLVLAEGGQICSMLYLMPQALTGPGFCVPARYVYALATDTAARGQGYARQLLDYAAGRTRALGGACLTTVPAQPSLHRFFSSAGFAEGFSTRLAEYAAGRLPPCPAGALTYLTPAAYNSLRRVLLEGTWYVDYPDDYLTLQAGFSRLSGGNLFQLEIADASGCAAVEYAGDDLVVIKELLLPGGDAGEGAALIARRLRAPRYQLRLPAFWPAPPGGYLQPFGMIRWVDQQAARGWAAGTGAYLGLGLD